MTQKFDDKELVAFKEMLMTNSIQVETLTQLLIEKRLITENEYYWNLKEVQIEYESKGNGKVG